MVDWFYIGYCVVMAMFAVAFSYAVAFGLRALRRLPRSILLGFAAAATVATLTAQKTNNVPPNMNQPQMQQGGGVSQTEFTGLTGFGEDSSSWRNENSTLQLQLETPTLNPVQTTSDDIARGWRVECAATNENISYEMPSNGSLVGNWHVHGAASSFGNNVVDFGVLRTSGTLVPTNWSFPLGTNDEVFSSFWYFIDGRIRPTPRDAAHEICAVGVPMSAVPGQSRLWRLDGDDGARILTWENFFLGGDTNAPVNAQIILRPNGDFITRSNEVETAYRRVNPDDWDDDGIHNERDANPASYDGDFFGVVNSLPPNANADAYYLLDLSVAGVLGVATIRVTCDGVVFPICFTIVEPESIVATSVWCETNECPGVAGNFAGYFDVAVLPTNVSFQAILTAELGYSATNAVGFFALPEHVGLLDHSVHGANNWHGVGRGNCFSDTVAFKYFHTPWGNGGSFTWPIENAWRLRSDGFVANRMPWRSSYDQRFELDADGTTRIRKFDYVLQQGTNLEFQVMEEAR